MPFSKLATLDHDALLALLHAIPQPVFIKNAVGELIYVNKAWQTQLGAPAGNGNPQTGFNAEQIRFFTEQDQQAFQQGRTITQEDLFKLESEFSARHIQTTLTPVFDPSGKPAFVVGTSIDVTEQHQLQQQNAAERSLLEMLASSVPLVDIMSEFIARFEHIFPGAIGSVLLMDEEERHLLHGAAPSLPAEYNQAIHGAPIGPRAGSCGTAAFLGEEVVVSDITSDPLWTDYLPLVQPHGLKACWSTPVKASDGRVVATFATYYRDVREPSAPELVTIDTMAAMAAMAIDWSTRVKIRLRNSLSSITG